MIKPLFKANLAKTISVSLLGLFITCIPTYSNIEKIEPVYVILQEPLKFDFEEIKKRGTIRMITRYSHFSYFLMDGIDQGFEYELVSQFAKENELKVEIVLIGSHQDPLQLLETGEGDLIADHFTINEELKAHLSFSKPYNFINHSPDIIESEIEPVSILKSSIQELFDSKTPQNNIFKGLINENKSGLKNLNNIGIAWATRKNSPNLKHKMDLFIGKHIHVRESDGHILRSAYLNHLHRRYFESDRLNSRYYDRVYDAIYTGNLTPYDDMVKSIASEADVDWKLVIAVMAQESAFDPNAESIAGALGLMQIIPRFSKVFIETELYEPEINIREGVRYLKKHLTREAHLDSLNRHSMALAAYNVGMGNLADARKLAARLGNDPDEWSNVADALLKLMNPEYYQHARYGYKKGTETVNYVEDVLNRYSRYQAIYEMATLYNEEINQVMIAHNW